MLRPKVLLGLHAVQDPRALRPPLYTRDCSKVLDRGTSIFKLLMVNFLFHCASADASSWFLSEHSRLPEASASLTGRSVLLAFNGSSMVLTIRLPVCTVLALARRRPGPRCWLLWTRGPTGWERGGVGGFPFVLAGGPARGTVATGSPYRCPGRAGASSRARPSCGMGPVTSKHRRRWDVRAGELAAGITITLFFCCRMARAAGGGRAPNVVAYWTGTPLRRVLTEIQ